MGRKELIAALNREAEERVRVIRREAETRAAEMRSGTKERLARLREEVDMACAMRVAEEERAKLREAEEEAMDIRLGAERKLSERLFQVATALLSSLREENYRETFRALAAELPEHAWETVTTAPGDETLAREVFPEAHVVSSESIVGGLCVEAEQGKVRVTNTLEKRLERAWEEMLPEVLQDVYRKMQRRWPA
jgi:V/A-type H+-transporting ATPase subunit E